MKRKGYILLLVSAYLILIGGIADIAMTFYIPSLPQQHLAYLQMNDYAVPPALKNLDHFLLRAIGGCLIGIGIGALTLIYTSLKNNSKNIIWGLLGMITISEGINALQLVQLHSLYFIFPFICVILSWIGAMLWWYRNKEESKQI